MSAPATLPAPPPAIHRQSQSRANSSRPFDWLYEALSGWNRVVVASALAECQATGETCDRTKEQWIYDVRAILNAEDRYTPEQVENHRLWHKCHSAIVIARQWEDNAESWRLYAEHLEDCIGLWHEQQAGQQLVIASLLDYLGEVPLPASNRYQRECGG